MIGVIGRLLAEALHFFTTRKGEAKPMAVAPDGQPWTLERRLSALAECGVRLQAGMTADDLTSAGYEEGKSPAWSNAWEHLLSCFGENRVTETEDQPPLSNDVLTWDSESIYDAGAYAVFVAEVARIAKGNLPATAVADHIAPVDTWLELTLDGRRHHFDLAFHDDWMDPDTTEHLGRLLEARAPDWCLGQASMGQNMVLICLPRDDMARLERLTDLKLH